MRNRARNKKRGQCQRRWERAGSEPRTSLLGPNSHLLGLADFNLFSCPRQCVYILRKVDPALKHFCGFCFKGFCGFVFQKKGCRHVASRPLVAGLTIEVFAKWG